jgi:hypothetical protein
MLLYLSVEPRPTHSFGASGFIFVLVIVVAIGLIFTRVYGRRRR